LQEKWRKEKEKTPAKGKASIVPAASLTYALHRYKIVAESWEDTRLQEKWRKEKKKTLAEGKASLAPPTSLTYALYVGIKLSLRANRMLNCSKQ
jgi:hypothetical protein